MLNIKVLGPGCSNCKALEMVTREAVASLGIEAEILKMEDYAQNMHISDPAHTGSGHQQKSRRLRARAGRGPGHLLAGGSGALASRNDHTDGDHGREKTLAYYTIVVVLSTAAGMAYGWLIG
jgi:hypothetical protein